MAGFSFVANVRFWPKADIEDSASKISISIEAGPPDVYKRSLSWRHEDRDAESI